MKRLLIAAVLASVPFSVAQAQQTLRAPLPGLFYPNGAQAYGTEFVRLSDVLAAADAVSLGGAGYNGTGAGSIAVSARIREDVIVYGAVSRGATQTLVKGGLGVSFR